MRNIKASVDFRLDGNDWKDGDTRLVDDQTAQVIVQKGWGTDEGAGKTEPPPPPRAGEAQAAPGDEPQGVKPGSALSSGQNKAE